MKIGVLSDTHISTFDQLPSNLLERLKEADLIVHLGDYTGEELLDGLRKVGNFRGVFGNMDSPAIRALLPETEVLELNGKMVGMVHGEGPPWGLENRIKGRFKRVDAILYGHSHIAKNEFRNGMLFFNPGSATGRFPAPQKTYGILTIEESLTGEIVRIM